MVGQILILFILMGIGFILRRGGWLGTRGVLDLVRINIDLLMPALTFVTTARYLGAAAERTAGLMPLLIGLPLTGLAVCLAGALIGRLTVPLTGLRPRQRGTFIYLMAFANSAFLPVPLSYALQGETGPLFVFLYNVGYIVLQWTFGMWLLSGRPQWKYLMHPQMICLVLGSAAGLAGWSVPGAVMDVLQLLGNCAIPLALLWVGAMLGEDRGTLKTTLRPVAVLSVIKLLVLPAAAFLVLRWVPEPMGSQSLMQAAMPVMAQAGLFAGRYGGDSRLGSAAALVTTILCVITVPLWMGSLR